MLTIGERSVCLCKYLVYKVITTNFKIIYFEGTPTHPKKKDNEGDKRDVVNKIHVVDCSLRPATLLKKKLWHRYFPVHFAKSSRTPSL